MFPARFADGRLDHHPVANRPNFPERHAGLDHAERPRVHSEEHNPFAGIAVFEQIRLVRKPGIIERIVNVPFKTQPIYGRAEFSGGIDHLVRDRLAGHKLP